MVVFHCEAKPFVAVHPDRRASRAARSSLGAENDIDNDCDSDELCDDDCDEDLESDGVSEEV